MKNVIIVENTTSGLKVLQENSNSSNRKYFMGGIFTEFGIKNRNERVYTAEKFIPHLNELLERKKTLGVVYGEFDHPDVFDTSLSRISHTIESLTYNKAMNRVDGEIRLLNTHYGKEAKALVDDGLPIFVSSRAAGVTESNGEVTIKKLFTYDAVADPGFSSARMSVITLNESLGFNENTNFRIFEMSDESKMNEYISMKNNDYVTKKEMVEYSNYLTAEIEKAQRSINEAAISGKMEPSKFQELLENYDGLQNSLSKITEYLDYLAEKIQVTVNENKKLRLSHEKLVENNSLITEKLENTIEYAGYLAEQLDNNIGYSKYIAETLDKGISFSEYIAEHVDKTIKYSDYLAENIDKGIGYAEYIAENLDRSIAYSEYVAEKVDQSIKYSEYIGEQVDNSIKYSEYIAEHVDNSIRYAEYIAENLQDSIAYSNYLSESIDQTIEYGKYIAEKINSSKGTMLNEDLAMPGDMKVDDVDKYYDEEKPLVNDDEITDEIDVDEIEDGGEEVGLEVDDEIEETEEEPQGQPQAEPVQAEPVQDEVQGDEIVPGMVVKIDSDKTAEVLAVNPDNEIAVIKFTDSGEVQEVSESRLTILGDGRLYETEQQLKKLALNYITEAKKREAAKEQEPHFLLFLNEKKKAAWYNLSAEDKEKVIHTINESNGYSSESDVMGLMQKALSYQTKSFNDLLTEAIPSDLKPIWESLDVNTQQSIINSAQFFSGLNESNFESFWRTRGLDHYLRNKKLITEENKNYDNYKLDEAVIERYKNVLRNI